MFDGRVAVVTGSAVGIGRGIAAGLAARGMEVAGLDVDAKGNAETAARVAAAGRRMLDLTCDVGDRFAVQRALAHVTATFGRIDVLVNNAAIWADCALTTGTYESQTRAFLASLESCALGSYYCARAAVPEMRRCGGGNIVNLITEHIEEGRYITGLPATGYDCAKFAQWRLTESWAVELAPHGIRVNALAFGATDTPMLRAVSVPIAEAGMRVEDLAEAVVNVLAHGPRGPTGQTYVFGTTGTSRAESLRQIAAIAPR